MTIKVASNSLRIQYFMTGQIILRSCIISFEIMFRGAVTLQYVSTDEQVADILTKCLGRGKFIHFRDKLGAVKGSVEIYLGIVPLSDFFLSH